jgi:hypothetical protein
MGASKMMKPTDEMKNVDTCSSVYIPQAVEAIDSA